MIGAMTGGEGLGSAAAAYFAQPLQGAAGSSVSLTGGEGAGLSGGEGAQSSAAISGPGQLLSNLQQLQAQDPTAFTQVVSQIASQLQSAAQQAQGPQSNFLSSLAASFQSIAGGGSLSLLQPQQGRHVQNAYSLGTQASPQGLAPLSGAGSSPSSGGVDLQQLFASISSDVTKALAG